MQPGDLVQWYNRHTDQLLGHHVRIWSYYGHYVAIGGPGLVVGFDYGGVVLLSAMGLCLVGHSLEEQCLIALTEDDNVAVTRRIATT